MHDELLTHQHELEPADLARYADGLGLDADRFSGELSHHTYAERVAEDVTSADASGAPGTPTFFVNGKRHDGAYDVASLTAAIRAARSHAVARRAA